MIREMLRERYINTSVIWTIIYRYFVCPACQRGGDGQKGHDNQGRTNVTSSIHTYVLLSPWYMCMCMTVSLWVLDYWTLFFFPCRHQFINNELIVKSGLVDKRKVHTTATSHVFDCEKFISAPVRVYLVNDGNLYWQMHLDYTTLIQSAWSWKGKSHGNQSIDSHTIQWYI